MSSRLALEDALRAWGRGQLVPFSAVAPWLPIRPRSVYQAHRRGTANYLTRKKVNGREVGQWLFDVLAYEAQVLDAGRKIPTKTQQAIERALLDQQEAQR